MAKCKLRNEPHWTVTGQVRVHIHHYTLANDQYFDEKVLLPDTVLVIRRI